MAANRCWFVLCFALVLVSVVSAWNDYNQGRRDSKSWQNDNNGYHQKTKKNTYDSNNQYNSNKENYKNARPNPKRQSNKDINSNYRNDERDYNKKYHHAGDWSNQQGAASYCDQYSHDPYKHAKCEAKRTPRQPAQDPRCQKYVYEDDEPHKLVMCEQRAQSGPSQVPQCQSLEFDPYKMAKCERKSQFQGSYQGGPLTAPQCGRYIDDLYKLSKCEDRAQAGPATQVPQCQQFAFDPYKLAKCEQKAEFWNDFKFEPTKVSSNNPSCQRYAYDLYKMQRCEYKLGKMLTGQFSEL